MDNILIAASAFNIFEKVFAEVQQILPQWGLQIAPEKFQEETLLII